MRVKGLSAKKDKTGGTLRIRVGRLLPRVGAGVLLAAAALWFTLQRDRAALTISSVDFDPPLAADHPVRIALVLKNSGQDYATITGAATDRVSAQLPDQPIYDVARIAPARVPGGGELRLISDLGTQPLIFSQAEIDSLKAGTSALKFTGFIEYRDKYWFLGGSVVGFCYVWDPRDADTGNFSVCSEAKYTYSYNFWFLDGIQRRELPMMTVGPQTVSPTTAPLRIPDPRFPIKNIETGPR